MMLDGVTVLSEQTVTESCFWKYFLWFVGIGFVVSFLVGILIKFDQQDIRIGFGFAIGLYIVLILMGLFICLPLDEAYKQEHTYTEYKVTIDSTVNFLDFEEKYIITGKEGQIYTVIDRDEYE